MIECRCPYCNKLLFTYIGKADIVVKVSCTRCKGKTDFLIQT